MDELTYQPRGTLDRAAAYLRLDDDECILNERTWTCVRIDDAHRQVCVERLMAEDDG